MILTTPSCAWGLCGETICAWCSAFHSVVVKLKVQFRSALFWIKRIHIAQTVVAIALILVLLAAATPFETLASGHSCQMACCLAKSRQASSDHCSMEEHHREQTSSSQTSPPLPRLSSPALMRPCSPDCCIGMSSFAQGRRHRDQARLIHAARPRPPAPVVLSPPSIYLAHFFSHLCDPSIPRGPPLFI